MVESSSGRQLEAEVLANIRHSLRTPLNQIIGYSEMIQEELAEQNNSDLLADLQKIHAAGGQLLALINDSLAPWRIESGKIDLDGLHLEARTPLNLIIGYSELCEEMAQESGQLTVVSDLQKINTAAKNLIALFETTKLPKREGSTGHTTRILGPSSAIASVMPAMPGKPVVSKTVPASLLIVDDNAMNLDMLSRRLEKQGHGVRIADSGQRALDLLGRHKFDLVLLDILMPEMDGFETLLKMKADPAFKDIPTIMLSALDEIDGAVRCIENGAEDYLPKPFNPVLLNARINACLEKRRLREQEQAYLNILQTEREKAERLLLNILPKSIADRLRQGESTIADSFSEATVVFADLVGFTKTSSQTPPRELVHMLNEIFSAFDWLAEMHGLEKIKTIGDAYMYVGGIPAPMQNHIAASAEMALEMQRVIKQMVARNGVTHSIRVGMASGPVVAGVIGKKKFIYDLWGDTVNLASRMESHGEPGHIHVTRAIYEELRHSYNFENRGNVNIKGWGELNTYFLTGRHGGTQIEVRKKPER